MTKEEFNWFWKDTTKEDVLNQFYYEHIQLREEIEKINKAIEYIKHSNLLRQDQIYDNSCDMQGWEVKELLEILRGED